MAPSQFATHNRRPFGVPLWQILLLMAAALCLSSPVVFAQAKTNKPAKKAEKAPKTEKTQKPAEVTVDDSPREPATPEEAAEVLDLRTFPVTEGAEIHGARRLGWLYYDADSSVKEAFAFQKQQFEKLGWKELPGFLSDATYQQGHFTRLGYVVQVVVSENTTDPKKAGRAQVMVVNHGNVLTSKLPVPKGVKPFYSDVSSTAYLTDAPVADTVKECQNLLLDKGWVPYGTASDDPKSPMLYFKRNAVRLMLWVSTAPAQNNATHIRYSAELLTVDLPMTPGAPDPRYDDQNKIVSFEWPGLDGKPVFEFYQKSLAELGWKATTDQPITDDRTTKEFLVFRNAQKDMISLDLNSSSEKIQVSAQHWTKAEVDEMDRLAAVEAQRRKEQVARESIKVEVALPIPANAKKLEVTDDQSFEFKVASGGGPAALESLREALRDDGWTEDEGSTAERNTGSARFKKENGNLRLSYFDTGVFAAEVSVHGTRVVLKPVAANQKPAERDDSPKVAQGTSKKSIKKEADDEDDDLFDIPDVDALLKDPKKAKAFADKIDKAAKKSAAAAKESAPKINSALKVADVPVPKDAVGVEYSKITKMIEIVSPTEVEALAKFYSDKLAEAGWVKDNPGLVDEDSAIMKFTNGDATLTIFMDREDDVTEVTLTTRGLAWDQVPKSRKAPEREERDQPLAGKGKQSAAGSTKPKFVAGPKITPAELKQEHVSLVVNQKTIKLLYGVGYQIVQNDETLTEILLTVKPIAVDKIVTLLSQGKDAGDVAGFDPHLKLRYDKSGALSYLFMYADGLSVNQSGQGEDVIETEIEIKDGAAKGKAIMKEPGKLFDNRYRIDATFNVKLANRPAGEAGGEPAGVETETVGTGLVAGDDVDDLPFPLEHSERFSSSSQYRKTVQGVVPAELSAVVEFYRKELSARGWKENAQGAKVTKDAAQLAFQGTGGPLSVKLKKQDDATSISLATRSQEKAKAAGILPQPNKGRLILANASDKQAVLQINGKEYKLAAGLGAKDPEDGTSLNVLPGKYTLTFKVPGQADQTEDLNVVVDETWGVIVLPTGGYLADQLY